MDDDASKENRTGRLGPGKRALRRRVQARGALRLLLALALTLLLW